MLSFAGLVVATFCYLQFFPPPYQADGKLHNPFGLIEKLILHSVIPYSKMLY